MKQEFKLLKQEIDMLPKDIRKDTLKRKREEKEIEQTEKVVFSLKQEYYKNSAVAVLSEERCFRKCVKIQSSLCIPLLTSISKRFLKIIFI